MKKKCFLYNFPGMAGSPRVREPSILYSVPDKKRWDSEFVFDNSVRPGGDLYLCTVFTCGYPEFTAFSRKVGAGKIIVGGYHPSLCPADFSGLASKIVVGFGNNIDEIIRNPGTGVVKGRFLRNHMDRSVFPLERLKEALYADIFPWQRSFSLTTFMGCPFACDFADNCYSHSAFRSKRLFHTPAYLKKELALLAGYRYDNLWIRDEGFFLHPQVKELVRLLGGSGKRICSFAGPLDVMTADTVKSLKDNGWFCLAFGMSVTAGRRADMELLRVTDLVREHGMNVHLNIIVRGTGGERPDAYLDTVQGILHRHLPASAELYFWTPYPGTESFRYCKERVPKENYDLLSDTTFKAGSRVLRVRQEKKLFALLVRYYLSREYAAFRNFGCGDNMNRYVNERLRLYYAGLHPGR